MTGIVEVEYDNYVAIVKLNRPEKLNALSVAMFEQLIETGRELDGNKDVRAVVLQGNGPSFCSGLDVSNMGGENSLLAKAFAVGDESPANFAQRAAVIWQEIRQPVIAAIHGKCFGGGLQIALGADIRIGARDVDMRVMEIRWGMIPDMGISQNALGVVPLDILKEWTWTGRTITADEAIQRGLLTHVSEQPADKALELAQQISRQSPDAVQSGKRLLNETRRTSLARGYQLEATIQQGILGQPNQMEAVMSNLEKRSAEFK